MSELHRHDRHGQDNAPCACAGRFGEETAGMGGAAALPRRRLLELGLAGAAGLALGGLGLAAPARAQTTLSPEAALQAMMEGNKRYVAGRLIAFDQDLAMLKQKTAEKQEPFASVLSCADSRVPVELAFDQSIGHLFVTRVAGNMATSEIIGSLEYGAVVLGTRLIMVMGHGACGAVTAAMKLTAAPGQISSLYPALRPAIDQAGGNVEAAIRANARIQAKLLEESSPVLADLVKQGKLKVVASYYDLATGRVTLL